MVSKKENSIDSEKSEKCLKCPEKSCKKIKFLEIILFITLVLAIFGVALSFVNTLEISNNTSNISRLQSDVDWLDREAKENDVKTNGVSYEGENGKTALELLKDCYKIETKEFSGVGEFVISIDNVKSEDGKNFWAFYVDGAMATEGASTYKTKDGEKIEWRLDAIQ